MKNNYQIVAFFLIVFLPFITAGQGLISGKITDKKTGESIVGASVYIQGTTTGSSTDIDGKYTIKNLKPGSYNIIVSFISYKIDSLKGIKVFKDKPSLLDHQLTESTTQLSEVSVTARKKTDTEIALINTSKQSNLIVVGVSSQQIAKSQDKDASEVIRRLPGVTIMDGRFVVVRGLIERYNSVWLNNASTPSSETDKRAFSFDVLPSSMINNMVIYKTPAPEIPADFAGAFIQITTKNIPEKNSFSIGYTAGYSDGTSVKGFESYKGGKTDWLGYDDGTRKLPGIVPSTNEVLVLQNYNAEGLTDEQRAYRKQSMLDISHSFSTISSYKNSTAPLDNKFNIDFSRIINAGNLKIGNITALSYKMAYSTDNILRAKVESYGASTTGITYDKLYNDAKYDKTVGIGAISNWSLSSGKNVVEFNNMFNQTGISTTIIRTGIDHYRDDNKVYKTMLGYSSRTIYSGSIGGNHHLNDFNSLQWTLAYSYANQNEPDGRIIAYYASKKVHDTIIGNDTIRITSYPKFNLEDFSTSSANANARLFSNVKENNYNGNINYQHTFNFGKFTPEIKAGVFGEKKNRDYYIRTFTEKWSTINHDLSILGQPIDSVYDPGNFNFQDGAIFQEATDRSDMYKIDHTLYAGYLAVKIPIGKVVSVYGGLRIEKDEIILSGPDMNREFATQEKRDTLNYFPSLNITFNITEKHLVRLAFGQTINRPEFREFAPTAFYDFKDNVTVYGNPKIKSCYVNNYDFRYEWYPSAGEMITVGGFYKEFKNPIEATLTPASGGEWNLQYLNAIKATSLGAEIDIRKGFQNWSKKHNFLKYFRNFSLILNAAYIKSTVETDTQYRFVLDKKRPMFGQSPYVVNAGLYYQTANNDFSVSLLYNVFGKRIIGVGTPAFPNSYEMPRHNLDLTIHKRIGKNLTVKFGVKDILNQEVVIQQLWKADNLPDLVVKQKAYKPGRLFSFGITLSI